MSTSSGLTRLGQLKLQRIICADGGRNRHILDLALSSLFAIIIQNIKSNKAFETFRLNRDNCSVKKGLGRFINKKKKQ